MNISWHLIECFHMDTCVKRRLRIATCDHRTDAAPSPAYAADTAFNLHNTDKAKAGSIRHRPLLSHMASLLHPVLEYLYLRLLPEAVYPSIEGLFLLC